METLILHREKQGYFYCLKIHFAMSYELILQSLSYDEKYNFIQTETECVSLLRKNHKESKVSKL